MRQWILFLVLVFAAALHAQTDSVAYNPDFVFKEGIYLNYQQFRTNAPVARAKVRTHLDSTRMDYLKQSMTQKVITYIDSAGALQEVNVMKLWGFCENNAVYINFNNDFNRIVVMGSLSHFTANYTSYMTTDPTNPGGSTYGTPVQSQRQYVLDIKTGNVVDFVLPNMEFLLKRDDILYKEFMAMRKGKRRQMMFFYLRKYNERNALYIYQ
ncbi:MAG TPA: hypothetical protein VL651_13330 [Bacteroidia bacterium]|jgi:hypothetical protein|nr:hypothetical protein [Bacteroidia bacterium]